MAEPSRSPATIAAWAIGAIVVLAIIGWAAGWFGGAPPAQQTGEQTPPATTQPAQPSAEQTPPAAPQPAEPAQQGTAEPAPATPPATEPAQGTGNTNTSQ